MMPKLSDFENLAAAFSMKPASFQTWQLLRMSMLSGMSFYCAVMMVYASASTKTGNSEIMHAHSNQYFAVKYIIGGSSAPFESDSSLQQCAAQTNQREFSCRTVRAARASLLVIS